MGFEAFPLITAVALSGVAAVVGRWLARRTNQLISRERKDFEARISAEASSLNVATIEAFQSGMRGAREDFEAKEKGGERTSRSEQRIGELESRLTGLEVGRQAKVQEAVEQREYHIQGLTQAKLSFMAAYVFGALGAIVILAGAVNLMFIADGDDQLAIAVFTAVAGAVPEAIAGLLFYSASRAGTQMSENFDRGRADRDLLAAQRIGAEIEDRSLGNRLQALLALRMAEAEVSDEMLGFLGIETDPTKKSGGTD